MIDIWGGIECRVNRVGDRYFDQVVRTGHHDRLDDLDRFAELGISAIRYPVLWERVAPNGLARADFSWTDQRLTRLRDLGIRPIVGLLHHGSGPSNTSLADPSFPARFAAYARAVAERYPWVDEWTPINEPVTTARFSGLYGHWYPHARDDTVFVRVVINQCRAIAEGMAAIREVIPGARYLHTDDAGTVFGTPSLQQQAAFENARRDLAIDLLAGRVHPGHPLWRWLVERGTHEPELDWFRRHPCPPQTIGCNYYITSDRQLDDRLECYPGEAHGTNGRQRYADVAAAHAIEPKVAGFADVLRRTWARYRTPLALTEVHMACTREEQVRWVDEAWRDALAVAAEGTPVRAITAWSLLGAYDWNVLVTDARGDYESGVFDVRSAVPRKTALFHVVRQWANERSARHHLARSPGWWKRRGTVATNGNRPLMLLGSTGTLGSAVARRCRERGIPFVAPTRQTLDLTRAGDASRVIGEARPWAVVNATGFVDVDGAEHDEARCAAVNCAGAVAVAQACATAGARLVSSSSDLVFDGARAPEPYVESHGVSPLNAYGRSKARAEHAVREALSSALIVRTSAFIDTSDPRTFVARVLDAVQQQTPFAARPDVVSPTFVPALADAVLDLLIDEEEGIWHLANRGAIAWTDLARRIVEEAGGDPGLVIELPVPSSNGFAPRPSFSALGSERGQIMPTLDASLDAILSRLAPVLV